MEGHGTELLTTVAIALPAAFIGGFVARRLRLPDLIGYLLAGVAVGPFTPGVVANSRIALELAEVGVVLLMFGVGLHFSVRDLLAVRRVAIPGAIGQIVVATALGACVGVATGYGAGQSVVLGVAISVASTVVLLRALAQHGLTDTASGRVAIGWLIVEDVFTVIALVVLPSLAPGSHRDLATLFLDVGVAIAKAGALTLGMLVVGARVLPWLLGRAQRESRELFTLAVLAVALGVAYAANELFGASYALGAFLAGAVLSGSALGDAAGENVLPLTDAFGVVFFVAVGMLLDPATLVRQPVQLAAVLAVVIVAKFAVAAAIVRALRGDRSMSMLVGAALAQIGEFSFIVATTAVGLGLLPPPAFQLVVASSIVSIALNPLVFGLARRLAGASSPASEAASV
jgi:CPA2 family monovalent cation:H+ antiporter-2